MSERTAILVLGMHRSGTSAYTRVLNLLGCDLAKTLIPADQFNERGYWESGDVAVLNDEILESAGSRWNDWERLNPSWYDSPKNAEFQARALELLARQFGDSRLFVLKDPRCCRLLPFWTQALASFGAETMVVAPLRDPSEVAASLLARNGMNPSIAQLVWLRHVLDAEFDSRSSRRVLTVYDDLLSDWRSVAESISQGLGGLAWPKRSTTTVMEVDAFLSADFKHHHATAERAIAAPRFSPWVSRVFDILTRMARGDARDDDLAVLDGIRLAFDSAAQTFGRPIAEHEAHGVYLKSLLTDAEARFASELEEREGALFALREALNDREATIEKGNSLVAERGRELETLRRQIDSRNNVLADYDEQLVEARRIIAERESELARRDAMHAKLIEERSAIAALLEDRDQERDAAATRAAHREVDLAESILELGRIKTENEGNLRMFSEASRSLRLRNEEFAASEAARTASEALLSEQQQALTTLREEGAMVRRHFFEATRSLRIRNEEFAQASARLNAIESSTTWRATALLRMGLARHPRTSAFVRRSMKLVWWTVSLQLVARLREYQMARGKARRPG
jgi:hypothetical protein